MRAFRPDTIIALGGGSPMDAAKVMWLLYEHPDVVFADLKEKFFDIRKRAFTFPTLGELAQLVCIPTTSGTGAEVTPFAVITDPVTGTKYPLADYALTPTVAIIDPVLTADMPASLAADSGFDALTHATEAYVSVYANDFTDGMALHAIRLIFENLGTSVNGDPGHAGDRQAPGEDAQRRHHRRHGLRQRVPRASCTPWRTPSARTFHLVHGRTNAILLPHVIRYNGSVPTKLNAGPSTSTTSRRSGSRDRRDAGAAGRHPGGGRRVVRPAVEQLRARVGIPASFAAQGVDEADFLGRLDELAMGAYRDQCAPANPRMPMLADMKELMVAAYYGLSPRTPGAG